MKKKILLYITALVLVVCLGACNVVQSGTAAVPQANKAVVKLNLPKSLNTETQWEKCAERMEDYPVDEEFIGDMNGFAFETAAALFTDADSTNLNYSPTSLYYALAVAALGAEGDTQAELLSVLGTDDMDYLAEQCRNYFICTYAMEEEGSMTIANSFWVDDSLSIKESFAESAAENFFATSHYGDFADPELPKAMSEWVSENTNNLLKPEFQLDDQQVFAIINTLYFASQWSNKFYEEENTTADFHLADGNTVTAEYMNSVGQNIFYKGENFTRSFINLRKGHMAFILPDEGVSVTELVKDDAALREAFDGGEEKFGQVTWQLPKFNFDSEFKLAETVKALGADDMFSDKANFSGISDSFLSVSDIRQGTKISVDEKGVEAAAYTEIILCGAALAEDRADMILDKPFLYGIYDDMGNLVFVGICGDPTQN